MARLKSNVDLANETKADKFKRLAEYRVNKILVTIGQLENLSSSQYEKTPEQVEKIEMAIYNATESAIAKLRKQKIAADTSFSL